MPRYNRNVRYVELADGSRGNERCCTTCNVWQREDEAFSTRGLGGYASRCRPCASAASSASRRSRRTTGDRRFGVELEFAFPRTGDWNSVDAGVQRLLEEMRSRGLAVNVESYGHSTPRNWKIVTDASVANGRELVSPILQGEDGYEQVRKVGEALAAAGAVVNRSCGLHIHHDVRRLPIGMLQSLVRNWSSSQDALDAFVAPSRRNGLNAFCRRLTATDLRDVERASSWSDLRRGGGDSRYRTLNFRAYPVHGTVEVRQHQGTVSGAKVVAWVKLGQAMVRAAIAGAEVAATDPIDLLDALRGHGLDAETADYLAGRAVVLGYAGPRAAEAATPAVEEPASTLAGIQAQVEALTAEINTRWDAARFAAAVAELTAALRPLGLEVTA